MNVNEVDFRELIQQYQVVLTRDRGGKAVAVCPFPSHKEKTASFSIDFEKKVFYCFGCGKGGSAVQFVENMDGCSREAAYDRLRDIFGVEFDRPSKRSVPPEVSAIAYRTHSMLVRLYPKHPWLQSLTFEQLQEDCMNRYLKEKHERKQYEENPGPVLYAWMEGLVDVMILDVRDAWRNSWPKDQMEALRSAHLAGDEEGYFSAWNEEVDRVITERDLLAEVERLCPIKCDAARMLMLSGNRKRLDKGRGILVSWMGLLKRCVATGLLKNSGAILSESLR